MCGIAGIINKKKSSQPAAFEQQLMSMAQAMLHRGPDAQNIYHDSSIGLAHSRLSIIDLASGAQPMQTKDGQLVVTFNGEIFNFIELRESLQQKGYEFKTHSDTEVILHLYREYGYDFPNYLNGQFAIGLYDKTKQELILVRDRVGICPLFFYHDTEQFIFASEIKAIKACGKISLSIDTQSLDEIFTGWTCLGERTVFKDVWQLLPGQLLRIDMQGRIASHQYWDLNFPTEKAQYDSRDESELIENLYSLLLDATKIRLRADVPVGAYLSGGLDSSIIVALIKATGQSNLRSFSLEFDDPDYDERIYQQRLVNYLNTDHSSQVIDSNLIAQSFVKTVQHTESPILRTASVPMGLLSQSVAQQNFRVVLTGEGADEVLGGYDIFKEAKVRQFWARNPDSNFRPLLLSRLYPYLDLPKANATTYLKKFFGVGLDQPQLLWHSHLPRWQTTAKAKMFFSESLKEHLNNVLDADAYEARVSSLFPQAASSWHWFNRAQYLEIKTLMANYLLNSQGDRMLMMNSVEGRFPYLDHRLIEFANRLPPAMKMRAMKEKYLLKKVAEKLIPADIFKRHKQPYRAPDVFAGSNRLASTGLLDYLSETSLKKLDYFDAKKVSLLVNKVLSGKSINVSESQAFTGILSTQVLHQEFCRSIN